MPKHWRIRPHDPGQIAALARAAEVPALVAQLLLARGVRSAEEAEVFLSPRLSLLRDPALLPDVGRAVDCISQVIERGQRITVYGDYDVDGMTGTALLCQCLRLLGANVGYYVPHRIDEGYGLNDEALSRLAADGTRLVVTVDCGIASPEQARHARELGLQLIITDHHLPGDELPQAEAIVHPGLPGGGYPFAGLSGSGVALKLAWALCQRASGSQRVGERMKEYLLSAVGLASLGTVADVVPLVDENRVLALYGLQSLKERPTPGIAALLKVAKLTSKKTLECEDLGFQLAPRLNAAGRLGQAQLGVELLYSENATRCQALAEYIDELNGSRKSLERSIYLAANKQAQQQLDAGQDAALVLGARSWHPGVIGIVAGRLAEKYHRPVIMVAFDELGIRHGIGSARSVAGVDVHRAIMACAHHLISCGGHSAAAGLKIEESRLDGFRDEFCEQISTQLTGSHAKAELWIEAETPLAALTAAAVGQIERLAPFGEANARPMFCATGVTLDEQPKKIGDGGRHLSLKLRQANTTLRGVAFGGGEWLEELERVGGPFDVAFRPVFNDFAGRRRVEVQLTDWRASNQGSAAESLTAGSPRSAG